MQNFELRLVIVILRLVMRMNRLDIWITIVQNFVEFRPWIIIKKKFFLLRSFRLECQSSAIAFRFTWFFHFFTYCFVLLVPVSVTANHKTATEAELLNKIAGLLKYTPENLVLGSWKDDNDEWEWTFKYLWIWTTLYESGSHYATTIQFCCNFPLKHTSLKTDKQSSSLSLSRFSRNSIVPLSLLMKI